MDGGRNLKFNTKMKILAIITLLFFALPSLFMYFSFSHALNFSLLLGEDLDIELGILSALGILCGIVFLIIDLWLYIPTLRHGKQLSANHP